MGIAASLNPNKLKNLADWKLLLFLVLFLDVKMAVKVAAIILIYLLQADLKFGFRIRNSRLPLFYPMAIVIAIANWLISRNFGINYDLVLLTGTGFWVLCILAMHQVKLSVEKNDTETIHRTIILFFLLNALVSFFNLAAIVLETGHLNPYTYQGQYQKYFIGTGDYIKGLTFDTSTTNAVLNAFGVIYFFTKKRAAMLLVCMTVMLFTGSNFIDIMVLAILAMLLIFKSTRDQKSLITICIMFLVIFMAKISPQNYTYVHETIKNNFFPQPITNMAPPKPLPYITLRPDSTLTPKQKKEKIAHAFMDSIFLSRHPKPKPQAVTKTETGRIITPVADINSRPYQHIAETTMYQKRLLGYIDTHKAVLPISAQVKSIGNKPGKLIGMQQTVNFFRQHPAKLLLGDGMGNFSSKLAFRVSGIGFAGGYPKKLVYTSPDFMHNHLDLYLNFFSKKTDYHSLTNNPGSVYDQLLAEYGLIGMLCFAVWYLGYFLKNHKWISYGWPIILLLMAVFAIDYWFEQLSILLFFELLMLLNIKELSLKNNLTYAK